jgi:hypothetical protein
MREAPSARLLFRTHEIEPKVGTYASVELFVRIAKQNQTLLPSRPVLSLRFRFCRPDKN